MLRKWQPKRWRCFLIGDLQARAGSEESGSSQAAPHRKVEAEPVALCLLRSPAPQPKAPLPIAFTPTAQSSTGQGRKVMPLLVADPQLGPSTPQSRLCKPGHGFSGLSLLICEINSLDLTFHNRPS